MLAMAIYCLRAPYVRDGLLQDISAEQTGSRRGTQSGYFPFIVEKFRLDRNRHWNIGLCVLAAHIEYLRKNILQRSPMRFIGIFLLFFRNRGNMYLYFLLSILLPEAMYAPNWVKLAAHSCTVLSVHRYLVPAGRLPYRIRRRT